MGSPYARQHGPDPRHRIVVAADEQRDPASGDIVRAAADRGVDDVDVRCPRGNRLVRCAGCRWCAVSAPHRPASGRQVTPSRQSLLDLLVGEDAQHHASARRRCRGEVGDRWRPSSATAAPLVLGATERTHLVTRVDEPAHHRGTHPARADERLPHATSSAHESRLHAAHLDARSSASGVHRRQRGVRRVEHGTLGGRRLVREARGVAHVLLQQRTGDRGQPLQGCRRTR